MQNNSTLKALRLLGLALLFPFLSNAQYCTPSTNCTEGDGVVEFGLGSFYNASGCGSDLGVAGYSDFTDLTGFELAPGVSYEGQFRADFSNQFYSIWIDVNADETFENSELILTDLAVGTTLVAETILIPATIPLGTYRLRLQAAYFENSSTDPCASPNYGETEDYTVNIVEPPSCIHVSGITLESVSATSALISWTDAGTSSVWDIEYGPDGFSPTGTPSPGFDNISNPSTIMGLNPVTEYDVYVRADCAGDNITDLSSWSAPFSFISACGAVIPSYYLDYADGLGACWELFGMGDLSTGPELGGFANWYNSGFANFYGIYEGSQSVTMYGSQQYQWMVSPDFDLTANGPFQVELDMAITAAYSQEAISLGSDDEVHFLISNDFGATWNTLQLWDESQEGSSSGEHLIYDLSAYDGEMVRFAIYTSNGIINDGFQFEYQVFVDNFRVQPVGSPLLVTVETIVEPNCFQFGGNPLADVLINVSGGQSPYTFLWTGGADTEDLVDAQGGIYTLEVTDSEGSTYTSDPIDVPGTPVLVVNAIVTNETYAGWDDGSIDITDIAGGTPPYFFQWNNAATTEDIYNLIDALWCVTISDANGCETDTCFLVEAGVPNSIDELGLEIGLSVYPNPSTDGKVFVTANQAGYENWVLDISDALGRVIMTKQVNASPELRTIIDMQKEASGIYILRLTRSSDGESTSTLIMR